MRVTSPIGKFSSLLHVFQTLLRSFRSVGPFALVDLQLNPVTIRIQPPAL